VKSIAQERRPPFLDLVRGVMDHQLLDSDLVECGKVDDVELEMVNGELRAVALLSGPGPASNRLLGWAGGLMRALLGRRSTRVSWREVSIIESRIKLRSTAEALGLGEADRAASRWIARFPGAE
jgi:hypothetical protein